MLLSEILGKFLAVELVQVLAGIGELVSTADHQRIVGVVDNTFQTRHLRRIDDGGYMIAHKEKTRFGVVDDVMNLFCIKLMKDGDGYCTIGECSKESDGPL